MEETVLRLQANRDVEHLEGLLEHGFLAATEAREKARQVVVQLSILRLLALHSVEEIAHLLVDKLNVGLTGQEVEDVDAKRFHVLAIIDHDFLDRLQGLVPVSVEDVNLGLLYQSRVEVLEGDAHLREDLKRDIVLLGLFEYLGSAEHGLELSVVAALLFVKDELKELERLLLKFLLGCGKVDPAL